MNARYICYGLRAGQIRVLHKDTATRALLRGHAQQIADMRFSPSKRDDVLASFSVEGNLFVKRIVSSGDDIEERPIAHVAIRDPADPSDPSAAPPACTGSPEPSSSPPPATRRLPPRRRPQGEERARNRRSRSLERRERGSLRRIRGTREDPRAGGREIPVVAVVVAPGGAAFAAAHADGAVRVWR